MRRAILSPLLRLPYSTVTTPHFLQSQKFAGSETPANYQKLILTDPCITRGERALVGVPKLVAEPNEVSLVCLMTAPVVPSGFVTVRRAKVMLPSMSLKFTWLNML